jgi:dATP pyrophosphohydrolase
MPSVNAFYEWEADRINLIPAFAALLSDDPVLDDEHDAFVWLPAQEQPTGSPGPSNSASSASPTG